MSQLFNENNRSGQALLAWWQSLQQHPGDPGVRGLHLRCCCCLFIIMPVERFRPISARVRRTIRS